MVRPESNSRPPAWQTDAHLTEPPVRGEFMRWIYAFVMHVHMIYEFMLHVHIICAYMLARGEDNIPEEVFPLV